MMYPNVSPLERIARQAGCMIEAPLSIQKKAAPGSVYALISGGLAANKERPVHNDINSQSVERRRIAAEYLTRAADDLTRATSTRIRYALLALEYGLSHGDIAALLGVSEPTARALVNDVRGGTL